MTMYEIYIGDIDNFDWDGDWEGNTPGMMGPLFPPVPESSNVSSQIIEMGGAQVEWGAWVVAVTKSDLLRIIEEWYGGDNWYEDPTQMPHLFEKLQVVKRFVASLKPDKLYGLVNTEW